MDLDTAVKFASIVSACASALGLVVIILVAYQVRQGARKRSDDSAFHIATTVQTADLRGAFRTILRLPEANQTELVLADEMLQKDAETIEYACEMWGVMVYEGVLPLCVLDRMAGGFIRRSWLKLRDYVNIERELRPTYAEWFEWLTGQLVDHIPDRETRRAFEVNHSWRRAKCKCPTSKLNNV